MQSVYVRLRKGKLGFDVLHRNILSVWNVCNYTLPIHKLNKSNQMPEYFYLYLNT